MFISIHEKGHFPTDTGFINEIGVGAGKGYSMNIPILPGTGNEGYQYIFDHLVKPVVLQYRPELILVSAGQDASVFDPLSRMMVTRPGFRYMAETVCKLAQDCCNGKLVIIQEGGYSLPYLPIATLGVIEGLLDCVVDWIDPFEGATPQPHSEMDHHVINTINEVRKQHEQLGIFKF